MTLIVVTVVGEPQTITYYLLTTFKIPNIGLCRMKRGIYGTFATDVACQQGTLTPHDNLFHSFLRREYICSYC